MRMDEMDGYRERIRENIGCDLLLLERPYDAEEIDGYVELMAETCASRRGYIRGNGEDVPTELVRKRFLKLDGEHIRPGRTSSFRGLFSAQRRKPPMPSWMTCSTGIGASTSPPCATPMALNG